MFEYVELQCISNFSFLRGASHPDELVTRAAELGYQGLGLCDQNSMAGVVRGFSAAKELNLPFFAGSTLILSEPEVAIIAYPTTRDAYGALCRLLTLGKRRAEKGGCILSLNDLLQTQTDLAFILPQPEDQKAENDFHLCAELLVQGLKNKELLSIGINKTFSNRALRQIECAIQTADYFKIAKVACGNIYHHIEERKPMQDVLTCIREKCSLKEAGFKLFQNAERYFKDPKEIYRLYRDMPLTLKRSLEIAEMCSGFSLEQLKYEYPNEVCPNALSPLEYLKTLALKGAKERYPSGVPQKVEKLLDQELALIHELNYEKYFLTCYDIVRFAREKRILCQGRGAAANSAVCYCLGITAVDPQKIDLLFARFVSKERNEPPDIDIDFEHERREEVIQYIYQRYGRDRAGLTCEVVTYRWRSAVREVGKAFGLALDIVDKLAKSIHRWTDCKLTQEDLAELGIDLDRTQFHNALIISKELLSFPRHLSQHVGGFIISERALCETVPIGNAAMPDRTMIEWDKDDIEILGMLKIDILGLGMLSCIRKALQLVNRRRLHEGKQPVLFHSIPAEDPSVYEMICKADTIGVFQIESRAQMSMLPRLKPRCFYDLVIEVAIVRPGPIQGNMVHPFLRRRNGQETIHFPDEKVKHILGKTLGVPIFQEQAMRLAIALAQFTPGEAEKLRRAMASWKRDKGVIAIFKERIIKGMLESGYSQNFAESCMNQIKGFSEYGFPESHAASFALLVYASAWLKKYYPAEFAAALLNSQPMGFYAPSQIITDAKEHAVSVRPIDVNKSSWDSTLEPDQSKYALRLGFRLVKELGKAQAELIQNAVKSYGDFNSVFSLYKLARASNTRLRKASLQALARADGFQSMNLNSREAIWEIKALPQDLLPVDELQNPSPVSVQLPLISEKELVFQDYASTGFSLRGHPIGLIRKELNRLLVCTAISLRKQIRANTLVSVAGIAIVRQRPHTSKGVVFVTLEDETGITNLIIKPNIFEQYKRAVLSSSSMLAYGVLERVAEVVYINVSKLESIDRLVLNSSSSNFPNRNYSY